MLAPCCYCLPLHARADAVTPLLRYADAAMRVMLLPLSPMKTYARRAAMLPLLASVFAMSYAIRHAATALLRLRVFVVMLQLPLDATLTIACCHYMLMPIFFTR